MPSENRFPVGSIDNIQVLRGVAALAVVAFHAREVLGDHIDNWLPSFLVGAAGVDVFFVVSGFVMVYSSRYLYRTKGASLYFMVLRIIRIVPVYWILSFFYFMYVILIDNALGDLYTLTKRLLISMLFIQSQNNSYPIIPVGWTLNFEMFFYFIFSIFLPCSRTTSFVLILLTLMAFVIVDPLLPPRLIVFGTPLVLEFAFGMAIAQIYLAGIRIPNPIAILIAFSGFVLLLMMPYPDENWWWRHGIVWGPSAVMITASVALAARPLRNIVGRVLAAVGDFSYSLYLTHWIVFNVIAHKTQFVRCEAPLLGTVFWVALVGAALLSGFVFHIYVDRPIHTALKLRVRRMTAR